MAAYADPSLTNSQLANSRLAPQRAQTGATWYGGLARLAGSVSELRRRIREREVLAGLNARELADFGASRGDVYRELARPFWRAPPPC